MYNFEMADTAELRRSIQKTFTSRCIYISKESLSFLAEQMQHLDRETRSKTLNKMIGMIEKEGGKFILIIVKKWKFTFYC